MLFFSYCTTIGELRFHETSCVRTRLHRMKEAWFFRICELGDVYGGIRPLVVVREIGTFLAMFPGVVAVFRSSITQTSQSPRACCLFLRPLHPFHLQQAFIQMHTTFLSFISETPYVLSRLQIEIAQQMCPGTKEARCSSNERGAVFLNLQA